MFTEKVHAEAFLFIRSENAVFSQKAARVDLCVDREFHNLIPDTPVLLKANVALNMRQDNAEFLAEDQIPDVFEDILVPLIKGKFQQKTSAVSDAGSSDTDVLLPGYPKSR